MASFLDDDLDSDNEDEFEESFTPSASNGTLFVVDCSDDMIVKDETIAASQIALSMEAIKNTYCNKLIGGSSDYLGVVLCGCNASTDGYPGIQVLLPLEQPQKQDITVLEEFRESCKNREPKYGHGQVYKPHELLWTCSSLFTSNKKKLGHRQVLIFTNVPKPYGLDEEARKHAIKKSRDMSELGITIHMLNLNPLNGAQFDLKLFYQDLIPDQEVIRPATDLDTLSTRVHRRETKLRRMANLPFVVGDDFTIGVECYSLFGSVKIPSKSLNSVSNNVVTCRTTLVNPETRQVILPHEQFRSVQFGTEKVVFTSLESEQMKLQTDKGIYLVGFQPSAKACKLHHVAGKALFVRPSENLYKGSNAFFMALLERCTARDVVALVHCVPRAGDVGYMGVLMPQNEVRDELNEQVKAAGFYLIRLPFVDDIRPLEYEATVEPSAAEIELGGKLVKKLKARYETSAIDNPDNQQFQKTLEALALEHDTIVATDDLTEPDTAQIDSRAGDVIEEFQKKVIGFDYAVPKEYRKPNYKEIMAKMQNVHLQGSVKKCTVADLRLFAKAARLKVPSTANKGQLVEAISAFFG